MKRLKRFLPEIVSLFAGGITWLGVYWTSYLWGLVGWALLLIIVFQLAISMISARFYHMLKRSSMWSFLVIQALIAALVAWIFYTISGPVPRRDFALAMLAVSALMGIVLVIPLIVCYIYPSMFSKRFASPTETPNQGGSNDA